MQWSARLIAVAQDCHKRGEQVTCKRARQTREEKDKKRRRVYVDKISVYLTDSNFWWVEKLTSTVTKEVAVPSFFSLLFPRASSLLARSLTRAYYPRPRDYLNASAGQEVG